MIIVNYKAGQLGNRLFHFSYFISNSKAHGYKLIYPFFEEYKDFFELNDPSFRVGNITLVHSRIPLLNKVIRQLADKSLRWHKKGRWLPTFLEVHNIAENDRLDINFDMNESTFVNSAINKLTIATGWLYNDAENFRRYADNLREIFKPKIQFRSLISEQMTSLREDDHIIVGVHIRRGDYKDFNDGRWFYNDDVYYHRMSEIAQFFKEQNKNCIFLIASNEDINTENFPNLNIRWHRRHFIEDLYLLAQCDYLIGPPSTFSMWASFYGRAPLFQMESADKIFDPDDLHCMMDVTD